MFSFDDDESDSDSDSPRLYLTMPAHYFEPSQYSLVRAPPHNKTAQPLFALEGDGGVFGDCDGPMRDGIMDMKEIERRVKNMCFTADTASADYGTADALDALQSPGRLVEVRFGKDTRNPEFSRRVVSAGVGSGTTIAVSIDPENIAALALVTRFVRKAGWKVMALELRKGTWDEDVWDSIEVSLYLPDLRVVRAHAGATIDDPKTFVKSLKHVLRAVSSYVDANGREYSV